MRFFNVSQIYPVISAALSALLRNGGSNSKAMAKTFIRLLEAMEKYHFINNGVCDRVGNEVEKLYAGYCSKFSKTKDLESTVNEFIASLKEKLASQEEFTTRFSEISYEKDSIPL